MDRCWRLPGHGSKYEDCGVIRWKGCLEHDLACVKRFRRSCGRAECPVCYEKWASAQAHRAEKRLALYKGDYRRAIHVTANPSEGFWDLPYPKLRRLAVQSLERAGLRGFCLIFHPWREEDDDGVKNGIWRYSPHFHAVGYGWIHGTEQIYDAGRGWVVKNHGLRKNVYATLMYQLSHAGVAMEDNGDGILPIAKSIDRKYHTLTWCGCLSYRVLKVPKEKEAGELCPKCGAPLVMVYHVGEGDPPAGESEAVFWLPRSDWRVEIDRDSV